MDVFSLGCTLAELFLDGQALFTYSRVLRGGYRGGVKRGRGGGKGCASRASGDRSRGEAERGRVGARSRSPVRAVVSLTPKPPPPSPPLPTCAAQLLAYRAGSFDPGPSLDRMPPGVQDLVAHMIQHDPAARAGAQTYLDGELGQAAFPAWMGDVLHPFFASMLRAPPDERVAMAGAELPAVHALLAGASSRARRDGAAYHRGCSLEPAGRLAGN